MNTSLSTKEIKSLLSNEFPGSIIVKEKTGSTNDDAKLIARDSNWAVIIADEQTNGRGRQGNSFYSPKGSGLYLSMVVPVLQENIFKITPTVAVSVCKTLEKYENIHPKIKWVNDILIENRKVCGILCETIPETELVIVGIGINLTTECFPEELNSIAGSVYKGECNRNIIAADLINNLWNDFKSFNFIEEYRKRSAIIGESIQYKENNKWNNAEAIGIAENGGLIIRENEKIRTLISGEISIRR